MTDFAGRTVVFLGRLQRLPRRLAARCVAERGGVTRRSLTRATDYAVFGGDARAWLSGDRLSGKMAAAERVGAACLGEARFLRRLGLLPPLAPETLSITLEELAKVGGLDRRAVDFLVVLDLFDGEGGRFDFRSLATARTAARLLGEGMPIAEVAHGLLTAKEGRAQRPTALVRRADGSVGLRWGDAVTDLSGQLRLPLAEHRAPSVDEVFEMAELADEVGDVTVAERLYRLCVALDKADPCAAFGLGNVLHRQGRQAEAKLYLRLATGIDPGFAEAWYTLALQYDREGQRDRATECYERAFTADPRYGDALFNAALIAFERGDYARAGELWGRYLEIDAHGDRARKARHGLAYCQRMTRSRDSE